MIEFLLGINWLAFIPWITAAIFGLFGVYQKSSATKSKAKAAKSKMQYQGEKKRADINEEMADAIIAQHTKTDKVINEKVEVAKYDRSHFL